MSDSEEYEQLKEDEKKIKEKLRVIPSDETTKLYVELDTISRRKTKIRNRM